MNALEQRLVPPRNRGHTSVARLSRFWYVACLSSELTGRPLARRILGTPIVLFRDDAGRVGALLDRCPHRNVPLSQGRVVDNGNLECRYHGWQMDVGGTVRLIPGLCEETDGKPRCVEAFPVRERDGVIWVYPDLEARPKVEPFALSVVGQPGYTTVVRRVEVQGSVHMAAENALDVPHTAYLHTGLFRGGKKNRITAVVKRWHDRVEAEYLGEPRPPGIAARILSPSGGTVQHWDRFFLPSVAQVEYRIGSENHILVTSFLTPVADFHTVMHAVVTFRTRIPGWLIKPILEPLAMRIFKQDAEILEVQTRTIHEFGGEQYTSTDIDVLGPHIWRLLRQAERGDLEPIGEPFEKRLELLV